MNQKTLPPLNWLHTFEASARHLNFTHAATELCLTQGAVSQQIRLLESHLGVALFQRLPRGLTLTKDGRAYYPVVQDAITRLSVGTSEIFSPDNQSIVKVRGSLSFFSYWLAPKLADFNALYPHIDIRYASHIWLAEWDDEEDMEIRWGHGDWQGLLSQRLTWDSLMPVCSPDLLQSNRLASPADLAHHTLLHVLGYEEGWGYWLNIMGEDKVDFSKGMQFDTLVSTLRMAELGQGVALARSSMVEDLIAEGRLIAPFDKNIEASESFYLVKASSATLPSAAQVFFDWLLEQAHRGKPV
ncbi:LysR substrate-binding domain-containing protein [Marinomonas aquiplantarum]|uniref:LysR family glycine cleavage system transcriptional activator n=1 Tax=Marinomonas aquiplantarum TaxID=491951 RepID=A0A366D3S5_9GAMM|nr:LysR substrate-binding domain-containing protein [Marinomonas aquiplantarum]RBO84723.1 LysR family glycine cleavage system transcriptional activator [Marinomonas aquiplantarum]